MQYDVTVIGSGPGGYVAAIRAAQLGMKTAIIEKYNVLGGTCLNVGCIPSKALLDSSEHFYNAAHHFAEHGIDIPAPKVNIEQMMARKKGVVEKMNGGINFLMKKNKITVYNGFGSFVDKNTIKIKKADNSEEQITTGKVIIATGSKPTILPFMNYDKKRIITSTEALSLTEIPKHLIVIGAGVIGAELGSVYARLGAKVTFVEFADSMIPTMDKTMGKELQKAVKKLGTDFYFNTKVTRIENLGEEVLVSADGADGKPVEIKGDYCLVCIGRRAYVDGLNLEAVGVATDRGKVVVDEHTLETNIKGIYAIGDVIRGAMLAHKAEEEGVLVAETMNGQKPHINYNLIPGVVYTWPEVASVGQTEEELKAKGISYKSGQFPFKALGRATASGDTDGLVKILANKETDEVLGVHIIGARAADMIAEAVMAMEFRASAEDIARTSHAHPTYMEAVKEAALAATDNRPIHT
ncbi:dihydrolipoyl dehydrogenase [Emticicia sp. BO119]|uniref:dihydrolipoyl dehydrogenase n=1 Tax=Emticicia sp. BO119 TaxID=2757768 RepID=UPI0015F048B9|nr:dihydrolipoyl dehydrogenase [Emticicia sp. BO119]MBA4851075.1 dihydrolipoyl dehydrogenase [Emticicia sp. BO119]